MIVIHFMISEQEPMLRLIIVYGGHSSTNRMIVSVSILISFGDLLIKLIQQYYYRVMVLFEEHDHAKRTFSHYPNWLYWYLYSIKTML